MYKCTEVAGYIPICNLKTPGKPGKDKPFASNNGATSNLGKHISEKIEKRDSHSS